MNKLARSKTIVAKNNHELTVLDGSNNLNVMNSKLPNNFFEKLINAEMELEEEFSQDKLSDLFQLYLAAIQYYSTKDMKKVKEYKFRMENHLTEESTLKNLSKINIKKYKDKAKNFYFPSNKQIKVRGRAKTIFKYKSEKISNDEIRKKVKLILEDVLILMKIDKDNLKNIINKELKKQRKNWMAKLRKKNTFINTRITRIKTICVKKPITPDRLGRRNSLEIEKNKKFEKSGKYLPKYPNINDESSEFDDSKTQDNVNDNDFKKLYEDVEGGKSKKNDSNSDDSNSESSIIGDNYQDYDISKDEDDVKSHGSNYNNPSSKFASKSTLPIIKETDENEENNNIPKPRNNLLDINMIRNYIEQFMSIKKTKSSSSKYLPKLILSLEEEKEEKEEKELQPKEKKENNDTNNIINDNKQDIPNKMPAQKRKSIVEENIIRKIDLDNEITSVIKEKIQSLENLLDDIDSGSESNFTSTTSLPSVNASKIANLDQIPAVYQPIFTNIEEKIKSYSEGLNTNYYNEIFNNFSLKLKELYDAKYEKYIQINNEYHSSIKENEFKLENEEKMDENEKNNIQSIIDSLKEEEKDQIDKIIDEYNNKISIAIDDFKHNCFKKNVGFQLQQEQLKLDIYTIINEAFY
jgi:hypothetical protein